MKRQITKQPPLPPWVIGSMSFLICGLGHFLIGQWKKGLLIMIGNLVGFVITGGISMLPVAGFAGYDAWNCARRLKAGRSLGEWEWLPGVQRLARDS